MCDVYIYHFVMSNSQTGEDMVSARAATLEAIEHRGGEPLMNSQLVVDHTQLDTDGFLVVAVGGGDSHDTNAIAAQIWSLETRAASRDKQAAAITDEREKYMLSLESRELRKQAGVLRARHTKSIPSELRVRTDARDFVHHGPGVAT
jgi:hypothetical protein